MHSFPSLSPNGGELQDPYTEQVRPSISRLRNTTAVTIHKGQLFPGVAMTEDLLQPLPDVIQLYNHDDDYS